MSTNHRSLSLSMSDLVVLNDAAAQAIVGGPTAVEYAWDAFSWYDGDLASMQDFHTPKNLAAMQDFHFVSVC